MTFPILSLPKGKVSGVEDNRAPEVLARARVRAPLGLFPLRSEVRRLTNLKRMMRRKRKNNNSKMSGVMIGTCWWHVPCTGM